MVQKDHHNSGYVYYRSAWQQLKSRLEGGICWFESGGKAGSEIIIHKLINSQFHDINGRNYVNSIYNHLSGREQ